MRNTPTFLLVAVTAVVLLAIAPLPAQAASGTSSAPMTLSDVGRDALGPQLVANGNTSTVVWWGSDGTHSRIQAAKSTDGGSTWSTPATLSDAGQNARDPQLITDGTTITATWQRFDGSNERIQAAKSTDGGTTWSTPATLSEAGQNARVPQLVTDGTTVTVTWRRFDGSNERIQAASSTDSGATWSAPVTLSEAGRNAFDQQVVTDGSTITAAWYRFDGSKDRIQAATSSNGGLTWSTPTTLSDAGQHAYGAQLLTDGTTITAAWYRTDGSRFRIQVATSGDDGATWSTPATLSVVGQDAVRPQLVHDGTTMTAIWQRSDGSNERIQAATSTDGGATWSTPTTISAAGQPASLAQLVTDGITITATWQRSDGSNERIQAASSIDGGTTWSTPVTLSAAGQDARVPQLVTDGITTTIIWYRSDGSNSRIQASTYTPPPAVSRLAGADRYATAVEISKEFAPNVPVVYLATGTNYPDALSAASAAAFQDGPLLLTTPTTLPTVVSDELVRLNPSLVVIVGGTGVVSAAVQNQVDDLLPAATIRRDSGVDRYATSRDIAAKVFSTAGATTAFIATGTNFPDALSASAAAGVAGAPVILVNGTAGGIDLATENLLEVLNVQHVVIAGGEGVVSTGIEEALNILLSGTVTRLDGIDRYATSVAINAGLFATANTVYLATGVGFADALAGAALAGNLDGPLYLVPGTCVPAPVLAELTRLGATQVVLLGGTGVLTGNVFNLVSC